MPKWWQYKLACCDRSLENLSNGGGLWTRQSSKTFIIENHSKKQEVEEWERWESIEFFAKEKLNDIIDFFYNDNVQVN